MAILSNMLQQQINPSRKTKPKKTCIYLSLNAMQISHLPNRRVKKANKRNRRLKVKLYTGTVCESTYATICRHTFMAAMSGVAICERLFSYEFRFSGFLYSTVFQPCSRVSTWSLLRNQKFHYQHAYDYTLVLFALVSATQSFLSPPNRSE